jgi:hypothetical protein
VNVLVDRCEEAFAAVIEPAVTALGAVFDGETAQVVTGKNSDDKNLPIVICSADGGSAEEETVGTGNYFLDVEIMVKHRAIENPHGNDPSDDPKESSQALVDAVASALEDTDLAANLTAAVDDFTVFPAGVFRKSPASGQDDEGFWINQFNYRVLCCASDLG